MKPSLTTREAAAALGVTRRTIYAMVRDGRLRVSLNTGLSAYRITAASVEAQREERETSAPAVGL